MIAKYILPWFGGSAATWAVSLVFFQAALLAGYLYAYLIAERLPLVGQAGVCSFVILGAGDRRDADHSRQPLEAGRRPVSARLHDSRRARRLGRRAICRPRHHFADRPALAQPRRPRRAPAALLRGLQSRRLPSRRLSHPFVIQPIATNEQQLVGWSRAFVGYCAALRSLRRSRRRRFRDRGGRRVAPDADARGVDAATPRRAFAWIGWSALGSLLLLAVTNAISDGSPRFPALWIAPLAVYLLTFVLAFGSARVYRRALFLPAFGALAAATLFIGKPLSGRRSGAGSQFLVLHPILKTASSLTANCMRRRPNATGLTAVCPALRRRRLPRRGLAVAFSRRWSSPTPSEYGISTSYARSPSMAWHLDGSGVRSAGGATTARHVSPTPHRRRHRRFHLCPPQGVFRPRRWCGGRAISMASSSWWTSGPRSRRAGGLVMFPRSTTKPEMHLARSRALERTATSASIEAVARRCVSSPERRDGAPNAPIRVGVIGMGGGMLAANSRPGDVFRFFD